MHSEQTTPNALIDRFEVGFEGVAPNAGHLLEGGLEARLLHLGQITTPRRQRRDGYVQLTFQLETEKSQAAGRLRLDLHMRKKGNHLHFVDRCSFTGNGLLMLRAELGPENCGGLSFDGKANMLGAQHHAIDLIHQQLQLLSQAIDYGRDVMDMAFPGWEPGALWIKGAEACRDMTVDASIDAARIIQHAMLYGSIEGRWDEYRRIGFVETKGVPTLRFISKQIGPIDKIYPKRRDALRAEVSCADRDDTRELTGAVRGDFNGQSAHCLFLHFLTQTTHRLDRLEQHARAVLAGSVSITGLLTAIKPLMDRAAGQQKRKGPASPEAQNWATQAVGALMMIGMFDARGLHANQAIRRELDGMCAPHGPLERHERLAIYYLKPHFAHACATIRHTIV